MARNRWNNREDWWSNWRDKWDNPDPAPEPEPPAPDPEPEPPALTPKPGVNEIVIMHNGIARTVLIDVPDNFDPTEEYSAVFVFHGLDASAQGMVQTGMADDAEALNYLTIYPSAVDGKWNIGTGEVLYDDAGL